MYLIWGNHDKHSYVSLFSNTYDLLHLTKEKLVLCHYAMRVWDKSHKGVGHLFGHSHQDLADIRSLPEEQRTLCLDVGVDGNNFKPWALTEIWDLFNSYPKVKKDYRHSRNKFLGKDNSRAEEEQLV